MIILSSFTSDYLKEPLQFLIDRFIDDEKVEINYGDIISALLRLKKVKENQIVIILFRLIDLVKHTDEVINLRQLQKNLQSVIDAIDIIKNRLAPHLVIVLCPSLEYSLQNLQFLESAFYEEMHKKSINLLNVADIQAYYALFSIENKIGKEAHIPYTPNFYIALACSLARRIHKLISKPYKVIVVDCDDTLWQGIVGDIGSENVSFADHHRLLQKFLIEKNAEGMLICLCSKNDHKNVIEVFKKRSSEMFLNLEHVCKYKINWQLKSENIAKLAQELNLGLDSFIFIDDSDFEIEEVKNSFPEVLCIQAPKNQEEFFSIKDNWAFDYNFTTEEDKNRSKSYRNNEKRKDYQASFNNYIHFLQSINLSILIDELHEGQEENIKRISILSGKTNQFNLFPAAKDIADIKNNLKNKNIIFYVKASDDFGDYGLVAVAFCHVQAKGLSIDSFFISCRAFKKGIEYHLIKYIAQYAVEKSLGSINLHFKRTEKNTAAQLFIDLLSKKFSDIVEDIYQIEVNKKNNIIFPAASLSLLEVNDLLEVQDNMHAQTISSVCAMTKSLSVNYLNKTNYLVKLQYMTQSLTFLVDKFFFDEKKLLSLPTLEAKIVTLCHFLLGEKTKDAALINLGLDSLKATELSYYLYQITGLDISIIVLLSATTTLQRLIVYIKQKQYNEAKLIDLVPCKISQVINASFQQKRIWVAEKKEINHTKPSSNYIMVACFSVNKLDVPSFKEACRELITRHDAFGCSFSIQDKELVQIILPIENRELAFEEYRLDSELSVNSVILKEAKKSFLMHEMPLIRFSVFVTAGKAKFYILLRIHHGIFDAISLQNTLSELTDLYHKKITNSDLSHSIATVYQYSDFIYHQNLFYNIKNYHDQATNYWSKALSDLKITTEFPSDKNSSFNITTEHLCNRYSFSIPQKYFLMLQQLAQATKTTIFNLITSLFSILISAYSYEDNIAVITATSGRSSPMFYKVIGFFVNLIVLPFTLEKNISFFQYAKVNYQIFLKSIAFQDFPFEKIQAIAHKQGISNILLNPALIYQSYKPAELVLENAEARLEIPEKSILYDLRETCRFGPFSLFFQEESKSMNCLIEYSRSLYSDTFIQQIANNFTYLISSICDNPYQNLHDISCVSEKEKQALLKFSKGPVCFYKEDLISIFQQHVFHHPNFIAISHSELTLTYRELDNLSTNLANHLARKGINSSDTVGLYFEKAYLFFITELALLKLNAVFVPLSILDPMDRLRFILLNSKISYVICDANFSINSESKVQIIEISKPILENIEVEKEGYLLGSSFFSSLNSSLCVLYTSGSTGTPKGVTLKQKGIIRTVKSTNYIEINNRDKIAQAAHLAFDAAQLECWLAWANGATLVIIDKNALLDYKVFEEKLLAEQVTVLWLTAALFHQYAYTKPIIFSNLKYLLAGGDIVEKKAIQEVFKCVNNDTLKFIIGYGPTEASIFTTTCIVTAGILNDFSSIPIGKPVTNTEIRLLNRFKVLAPMGAKAHLAIGGDSLAEGYLDNPELQKERFIFLPEVFPSTLYLSGDQVRLSRMDNPQLLFCGRMDADQVKRAGFLVSLSEIEAALMSHPAIKQVALIIKELDYGKKQLIAFYLRNKKIPILDNQTFLDYLSNKLPSSMFPDFYQELDRFPITLNGKLDKKALLLCKLNANTKNHRIELLTDSQKKISDLFKTILSLSFNHEYKMGLDDSFFNCGGTSILAVQLIYEIEQCLSIRISFDLLRQNASIRSLDKLLTLQMTSHKLEKYSSLIYLKKGDESLVPIGFIHPAGGALYCYEPLIKGTLLNNSFFGIEDPVLSYGLQQNLSIQEMAKNYLLQIEEKIKQPFILSGYSFGGMLALEMASQLEEKQSNNLIGVILIDTWIVSSASEQIKFQLKKEVLNYYAEISHKIGENRIHLRDQLEKRYRYLQDLGFAFQPKKINTTKVILLKASSLGSSFENMAIESKNNYLLYFVNDKLFDCIYIPGNHYSIIEGEYISSTSKAFSAQITELQKQSVLVT